MHTRLRVARTLIRWWTRWLYVRLAIDLRLCRRRQLALARRYAVDEAGCESYGPAVQARIAQAAARIGEHSYALTSGTTAEPKRILYPRRRLRRVRQAMIEQTLLTYEHLRLDRPVFYTLTDLLPNASLSSLLAHGYRMTPSGRILERTIFADSFVPVQDLARLAGRYSPEALHITCMALISPTTIVVLNPSSLFAVLAALRRNWPVMRTEVAGILGEPAIGLMLRRLGAGSAPRALRLRALLDHLTPPHPADLLEHLRAVYCWGGGDVNPYIENLRDLFADRAPVFSPMFSISTETIACEIFPRRSTAGGFPIAPGVCYEFLPDDEAHTPVLLKPWELTPGRQYIMLVSDQYGLRRYNTEDVFLCTGMARHTPLLRFLKRSGLTHSFTGEKLTGEQLSMAYELARRELEMPGLICTCFPVQVPGETPGYVFACWEPADDARPGRLTADLLDRCLTEINIEYATKRGSGRLAPPRLLTVRDPAILEHIIRRDAHHRDVSPTQGKLLPLYDILWDGNAESIVGRGAAPSAAPEVAAHSE